MIHRAPFGSLERFVGLLIEHFEGKFPTWLAPEQVRVLPLSDKFIEHADAAAKKLADIGVRVSVDRASEKLGAKIRLARLDRVPYMLVIGAQEAESNTVSVRHRDRMDLGAQPLDEFIQNIHTEITERSL
jgi:threonyl-tRNA synthetase